jgi:hypothetical protein
MGAWLSNSNDAISGNYKNNDQYWDAVTAEYNSNTSDTTRKRQMKQCMSRWHRVNKIVLVVVYWMRFLLPFIILYLFWFQTGSTCVFEEN